MLFHYNDLGVEGSRVVFDPSVPYIYIPKGEFEPFVDQLQKAAVRGIDCKYNDKYKSKMCKSSTKCDTYA